MSRITVCLDCPMYQTGGWCKHKRKDVGALQPACDHAKKMNETFNPEDKEEEPMTDMNTRTEATKLCKKCGRHLTLDHFGKKNGTKDGLQYWCKECLTKGILETRRAKKEAQEAAKPQTKTEAAKPQTKTEAPKPSTPTPEPEPLPIFNPVTAVQEISDDLLTQELRRRGWDVKATRPKTIIEEL